MQAIYDVAAPAKLNLFLHVVGKRPDGYHLLESVFCLIDWADTLHFERRTDGRLARHDAADAAAELPPDDLCLRAARLLQAETGCAHGVDIHLDKRLPAGAGMGGGSSDAASTLLALNRLWELKLPRAKLLQLGLKLGADVPFFIGGRHAFVQGIGEILSPISLPVQTFAVLKPTAGIGTQQIFSSPLLARSKSVAIVAGFPAHNSSETENDGEQGDPAVFAAKVVGGFGHNDLQKPAEAACPEVIEALKLLESEFGNSRMTGSGSAVFARVGTGAGKDGMSTRPMATIPTQFNELPAGWVGRICRSLDQHPLRDWAED